MTLGSRRWPSDPENSSRNPRLTPSDPLPGRANYLVGARSAWRTDVAQYGRVRYSAVYPGIDLVYYGNGTQLEYDFVLQPQADPARIRMSFTRADRLSLAPPRATCSWKRATRSSCRRSRTFINRMQPARAAR